MLPLLGEAAMSLRSSLTLSLSIALATALEDGSAPFYASVAQSGEDNSTGVLVKLKAAVKATVASRNTIRFILKIDQRQQLGQAD